MKDEEFDILIETALREKQEFSLPDSFAENVTTAVARREQWKDGLIEYLCLSGLFAALLTMLVVLFYYIDKLLIDRLLYFFGEHMPLLVLFALLLNFVLFADKVLLKLLFSLRGKS